MKKAAFHNLGCKVNSYELDIMRQILLEEGYEEVPFHEQADVYVINTCTVTNIADRKSRQMLHRAIKQNREAVVIAACCYVETDPERVEKDDAIDLVIGNNRKSEIGTILREYLENREKQRGGKEPEKEEEQGRQDKPFFKEDITSGYLGMTARDIGEQFFDQQPDPDNRFLFEMKAGKNVGYMLRRFINFFWF